MMYEDVCLKNRSGWNRFMGVVLWVLCGGFSSAQVPMEEIRRIIEDKHASVGVAVLVGEQEFVLNDDVRYPLMSVFKFHVALAALDKMAEEHIALDDLVFIEAESMRENTYSPLRQKYPAGRIRMAYRDMIEYTLAHSDNNTCDWLIDFVGGIGEVERYVRSLGIGDFGLTQTENSMHEDISACYDNWSTPLSTARLLKKTYETGVLPDWCFSFLEQVMRSATTGMDKFRAGLPAHAILGHKTGSSDRTAAGLKIGDNDAGVIWLPDGRKCYLVVFVKDSAETDAVNAKIMADISRLVYESLTGNSDPCGNQIFPD